ncbi:hypothetical protein QQS21_000350 [Conoideocrella luteorostrata]|uniref:GP-PDE domain-containing protein n=1 Tax=Conoideocrella luteorostrata TaxID=1105319 RepID=A0AAJ0CZ39_9HYPO|nr:hypothetical protein QQS21_000350 [Conoideocrella luteorostrata]
MFRLKISESAARRENEICRIFGFPTAPVTLPNIGSVDGLELQVVRVMYEDLLLELREIQWFDKVNHTAMEKLFGKLANYRHDKIAFERCYSRWVTLQRGLDKSLAELLGRVDKLVSEIRKESTQSRLGTHSWCIAGRVSHTPPATDMHDMIYKFLKNDQHSLVKEHVLSSGAPEVTTGDNIGLFVGDLFLISIIFSAKYTKALTLEIIPCEQVSAEHFFLIVKIYGIEFQRHLSQSQNFQTEHLEHAAHEFTKLLNASGSKATDLLQEKDSGGCLLLHHAAHYGLDSLCKVIICHLINTSPTLAAETLISTDHYGRTPFHYAVDGGNLPILTLLLNALSDIILDKQLKSRVRAILGDILILALRAGTDEMAKIVLEHGPDLLHRSSRGETALYVAVQFGNLPLARLLTSQLSGYELSLEAVEQTRGWTPLMVACANGHTLITKLLLHAGAKQSPCDARGWTALEHAVFRGHHVVAELFKPCQPSTDLDGPAIATRAAHKTSHTVCSADQKMLIVHLGSTQGGHDRAAIQLEGSDPNDIYTFPQEYPLEMQISVLGTPSVAKTIQLPPLEDQLHKPLIFRVEHGVPLQIVLKICRRGVGSSETLVCSGTSLLDQESVLGDKHESLIRERTVYMVDKEKSGPAGSVLLSYVIAESFSGLEKPSASSCPRSEEGLVRLVGHRGLGQNVPSRSFLQLGENTVMSFLSAAKFGASFVEVTSDLEAVIYHDFSLSESGTNIPVHDLTLAQYKHASDVQEPRSNVDNSIQPLLAGQRKPRAWSSGEESVSQAAQLRRRLQCTVDFQTKGFKPNSRGDVVQDSLTTLEELLVKLPLEIGFNIEITKNILACTKQLKQESPRSP